MSTMPVWTQAEIDIVVALAAQGLGATEISKRIGTRTRHAVSVKLCNLGMRTGGLARHYIIDAGVMVRPWASMTMQQQVQMRRRLGLTE